MLFWTRIKLLYALGPRRPIVFSCRRIDPKLVSVSQYLIKNWYLDELIRQRVDCGWNDKQTFCPESCSTSAAAATIVRSLLCRKTQKVCDALCWPEITSRDFAIHHFNWLSNCGRSLDASIDHLRARDWEELKVRNLNLTCFGVIKQDIDLWRSRNQASL